MAGLSRVHEDTHGMYVVTDSAIFRPILPVGYQHCKYSVVHTEGSKVAAASMVKATHLTGTPLAKIRDGERVEYWFCHGHSETSSVKGKIDSNTQFKPDYFRWE